MASRPRMAYEVDVSRLDIFLPLGVVVAQGRDSRLSRSLGWRARSAAWTGRGVEGFLPAPSGLEGAADVRHGKAAVGGPAWGEQDLRPLRPAAGRTGMSRRHHDPGRGVAHGGCASLASKP